MLKGLRNSNADFFQYNLLDSFVRKRLDPILQARKCSEVGHGKQVGACGEKLAELYVGRSESLEIRCERFRFLTQLDRIRLSFLAHEIADLGRTHEIRTPILRQEANDVFIPLQMSWSDA